MMITEIAQDIPVEMPLLRHYPALLTRSPDEARHVLHSAYGLQDLTVVGDKSEFCIEINHKPLKDISLSFGAVDGAAELAFPEARIARQLFCLSGEGAVQVGKTKPYLPIDHALPIPIGESAKARYVKDFRQLILRVDETALIKKLTALLGREPNAPIALSWEQPASDDRTRLRELVFYFAREIERLEQCSVFCPVISEIEQAIVTTFLYANRSNYSDSLRADPKDAAPWQVRTVEEYIECNWDQPIDMLQLVKITGASARSIYQAFARTRGYSPKAFLKQTRLKQARTRLQSNDPGISVTAIALSCGFNNLGHFARDYRELFGELPSETLAKHRSAHFLRGRL
jgi:AraC-like DNA-binding protein